MGRARAAPPRDGPSRAAPARRRPPLPGLTELETTRLQYRISDLSTGHHLIHFYRGRLQAVGALRSSEALQQPSGREIRTGGLVITRQVPSTANKIRFFTLEDEDGHVNVTIKPDVYEGFRRECAHAMLVIDGVVQSLDNVWSLLATSIAPLEGAASGGRSHDYC